MGTSDICCLLLMVDNSCPFVIANGCSSTKTLVAHSVACFAYLSAVVLHAAIHQLLSALYFRSLQNCSPLVD